MKIGMGIIFKNIIIFAKYLEYKFNEKNLFYPFIILWLNE